MVQFTQRLDSASKIYIPKVLRKAGFDQQIELVPNTRALVAFPSGTPLEQVLVSLRIIQQDLEQSMKLAALSIDSERLPRKSGAKER